jgi:U1 small nuclear ribonucleoprotein
MTALLPPNLLRLFAPRDPVPYLRPLTKDDADRGPDKLRGVGALVTRLKEEADAEEIKKGMDDSVVTQSETSAQPQASKDAVAVNGDGDVDMEAKQNGDAAASSSTGNKSKKRKQVKPKKMDKIAKLGVVGQEARVMRAEERAKRKEQYKKDQEKNCA